MILGGLHSSTISDQCRYTSSIQACSAGMLAMSRVTSHCRYRPLEAQAFKYVVEQLEHGL